MKFALPSFASASVPLPAAGMTQRSKMMEYDQPLVWVVILLMLFGMVMVYSASISLPDSPKYASYNNNHFLIRQASFAGGRTYDRFGDGQPAFSAGRITRVSLVVI